MHSLEWYTQIKKDQPIWRALKKVEKAFSVSDVTLPVFYRLRIAEFAIRLKERFHKKFGLFICFGWVKKWNDYADIVDSTQDIFREHHIRIFGFGQKSIQDLSDQRFMLKHVKELIDFDGAILISKEGAIISSGVYLENLSPKDVSEEMRLGRVEDLSEAFGFAKKVHTRHLAAIAASYKLKGTTIFVMSEEDGSIRIFEKGKIIWSTMPSETQKILER